MVYPGITSHVTIPLSGRVLAGKLDESVLVGSAFADEAICIESDIYLYCYQTAQGLTNVVLEVDGWIGNCGARGTSHSCTVSLLWDGMVVICLVINTLLFYNLKGTRSTLPNACTITACRSGSAGNA